MLVHSVQFTHLSSCDFSTLGNVSSQFLDQAVNVFRLMRGSWLFIKAGMLFLVSDQYQAAGVTDFPFLGLAILFELHK